MTATRPSDSKKTAATPARGPADAVWESQVITDLADFDAVEDEWKDYLQRSARDHDFTQHPDIIKHDFAANSDIYEPMVIILRRNGQIAAVAPWHIHPVRFSLKLGVVRLLRVPLRLCKLAGADMTLSKDVPIPETLDQLFASVHTLRTRFDVIALFDTPIPGYMWDYLESVTHDRRFRNIPVDPEPLTNLRVILPDSFDAFMASLSSKKRNSLRRHERDLNKASDGTIETISIRSPEQVPSFFEAVRHVYETSWQGHTMGDTRGTDAQIKYCQKLAANGWLRCHLVRTASGPICYSIAYRYGDGFYCQDMAYDPAWRKCAPGNYMFVNIVKDLFECDPPQIIDFGAGDSAFKRQFANDEGKSMTLYLVPSGRLRGRTVITIQRWLQRVYVRVSALLTRLGIDRWVRERIKRRG